MADALTKINLLPLCRHTHHFSSSPHLHHPHVSFPPPPIYDFKSPASSSHPLNKQRLFCQSSSAPNPFSRSRLYGKGIYSKEDKSSSRNSISPATYATSSHGGLRFPKAQKWWEKGLQPNMKEVTDANDLVQSLLNAGDKLVVVDFFSPGCGGCKALHPKLCQLAEMNPDVQFLQVNHDELKSMCYSLGIHVLPFFRFYRGAHGRLGSFSCTIATIKKLKDALVKHGTARCSLGPNKGLEEKELLALAANKELSFNYVPKPVEQASSSDSESGSDPVGGVIIPESKLVPLPPLPLPLPRPLPLTILQQSVQDSKENASVR